MGHTMAVALAGVAIRRCSQPSDLLSVPDELWRRGAEELPMRGRQGRAWRRRHCHRPRERGVVASATGLTVVRLRRVRVELWIACIAEREPLRLAATWPGGVDKRGVVAKRDSFLDAGEVLAEEELC